MVFSSVWQLDSQPLPYTGIFAQGPSKGKLSKQESPKVILGATHPITNYKLRTWNDLVIVTFKCCIMVLIPFGIAVFTVYCEKAGIHLIFLLYILSLKGE